jgi:hypothetical protein
VTRRYPFFSLLLALALAGCPKSGGSGGQPPVINFFTATPATVTAGQTSSTLSWSVSNATSISIDNGLGPQSGTTAAVSPAATTTYTLTATNAAGSVTAQATVTVTAAQPPAIASFGASPNSVSTGASATLSWTVTGTVTHLQLDPGAVNVTGKTTVAVSPTSDTTYTLTATGPGGTATASVTVTVHAPNLHLAYTDPPAGQGKLRLVVDAASTATHLILDLKVGASPLAFFGVALNIPLDTAQVTFAASSTTTLGGLIPNRAVIDPGSAPATAAARMMGAAAPDPLRNVFILGLAQKKLNAATGDVSFNPGDTILQIAFDMAGTAPAPVWQASLVTADKRFKAKAVKKNGSNAAVEADFALGDLSLAL